MYLIQLNVHRYGKAYYYTDKPKITILDIIERMKKARENTYICISATNLDTSEIRVVWDNRKNQTLFGNS